MIFRLIINYAYIFYCSVTSVLKVLRMM